MFSTVSTFNSNINNNSSINYPQNVTITSYNGSSITFSFTHPPRIDLSIYNYTATLNNNGVITTYTGITSSPYTITGLSIGTNYILTLVANYIIGTVSINSKPLIFNTFLTGYTFRIKGTNYTVPTKDTTNTYTITNTGSTTMFNDSIRGYVFSFSGSNFLQVTANSPINSTKTFWVSTSTPSSGGGNLFSSVNYPIWFESTNYLKFSPNFNNGTGNKYISTISQPITWAFYAITTTSTNTYMYINGNTTANIGGTITGGWAGETNVAIQFGAYVLGNFYTGLLDDMRLYPTVLTNSQIQQIYNGG